MQVATKAKLCSQSHSNWLKFAPFRLFTQRGHVRYTISIYADGGCHDIVAPLGKKPAGYDDRIAAAATKAAGRAWAKLLREPTFLWEPKKAVRYNG